MKREKPSCRGRAWRRLPKPEPVVQRGRAVLPDSGAPVSCQASWAVCGIQTGHGMQVTAMLSVGLRARVQGTVMARDREVPCARGAGKSPCDLGLEGNTACVLLGLRGERDFQVEQMAGSKPGRP